MHKLLLFTHYGDIRLDVTHANLIYQDWMNYFLVVGFICMTAVTTGLSSTFELLAVTLGTTTEAFARSPSTSNDRVIAYLISVARIRFYM